MERRNFLGVAPTSATRCRVGHELDQILVGIPGVHTRPESAARLTPAGLIDGAVSDLGAGFLDQLHRFVDRPVEHETQIPASRLGGGALGVEVRVLPQLRRMEVALCVLSYLGGELVQIELGMPQATTGVFQGMLLFFLLGSDVLIRYRLRFDRVAREATS